MNIEYTTQRADSFVGKQSFCFGFFLPFQAPFFPYLVFFYRPDFSLEAEEKSEENQCFWKWKYIYIYTYIHHTLYFQYNLAFLSHSRTQQGKLGEKKKSFNTRTYRFLLPLLLTWEDQLELNIFRSYLGRKNIGSWVWEARHYRQREILGRVARNRINRESEYWNSSAGKKWWIWRN